MSSGTETAPPVVADSSASYEQIMEHCVGANAEFVCDQLKAKATAEQAQRAWMVDQQKRIAATEANAADVKAAAESPGHQPVGSTQGAPAAGAGDPKEEWAAAVKERMDAGATRSNAVAAVAKNNHDLHVQFMLANNDTTLGRRLIGEKFG